MMPEEVEEVKDHCQQDNTSTTTATNMTCWYRFRIELILMLRCRISYLFSIDDPVLCSVDGSNSTNNRHDHLTTTRTRLTTIDIPNSFAPITPHYWLIVLWKCFACGMALTTIILGYEAVAYSRFYLAYLTNWGVTFCTLYLVLSLYHVILVYDNDNNDDNDDLGLWRYIYHRRIVQPPPQQQTTSWLVIITWISYLWGIHTTAVATLLYWPLVYDPQTTVIRFTTIVPHGGLLVLMIIDGMYVNRIPMYMMHWCYINVPLDLLYVIWTLLHDFLQIGNPDNVVDNDMTNNDDDSIYAGTIMWLDNWQLSLFWSIVCVFVLGPLMFVLLWSLSHGYLFRCCCCAGRPIPSSRLRYYDPSSSHHNEDHYHHNLDVDMKPPQQQHIDDPTEEHYDHTEVTDT